MSKFSTVQHREAVWIVIGQRGAVPDPNLRFYNVHLLKELRPGSAPSNWVTELHDDLVSSIVSSPSQMELFTLVPSVVQTSRYSSFT